MDDLATCLGWKGRRIAIRSTGGDEQATYGVIVHVSVAAYVSDEVDLAVRLDSGAVTILFAKEKGASWDFADSQEVSPKAST